MCNSVYGNSQTTKEKKKKKSLCFLLSTSKGHPKKKMAFGNLMLILSFILSIELIGVMCASPILEVPCNELGASQMICDFDCNCRYGVSSIVSCVASNYTNCTGDRTFNRTFTCEFCWQTNAENYACASNTTCYSARNDWYVSNCSIIDDNYLCIGMIFGKL